MIEHDAVGVGCDDDSVNAAMSLKATSLIEALDTQRRRYDRTSDVDKDVTPYPNHELF